MSNSDPKSCNRQPFLSEAGCDRGNVDIHQFDDLPYCEPVNPTMPSIPPEIVDTPIELPVPPSCACVNIEYALNFKYSQDRKFSASASFSAQGDCCEGNYVSNFNLQIPCPIIGGGSKKIKMKIGYGTGKASVAASYIKANANSCTVEANDVDINLNIPCPVKDAGGKKIKIGISYGDGPKGASASFIKANTKDCEIEPLSPTLHLNLPCPIIGRGDAPKIKASIKYGNGDNKVSANYINADPNACTIEPLSPTINLNIPCPVKDAGGKKIKIGISYGNGKKEASALYLRTDTEKCELEALAPTFKLNLPCPVRSQQNTPTLKAKIGWGNAGSRASADLLSVNAAACEIMARDVNLDLNLPCPVRRNPGENFPKFKAKIGWGSSGSIVSSSFLTADSQSCRLHVVDKQFRLNLKCPFNVSTSKWESIGNDRYRLLFKLKYKYQNANNYTSTDSVSWMIVDRKNCTVEQYQPDVKLNIPCPITADSNGLKKLKITSQFKNVTEEQVQSTDFWDVNKDSCTIKPRDVTVTINVPCPTRKSLLSIDTSAEMISSSTGKFEVQSDSSAEGQNCGRHIKLKVAFPKVKLNLNMDFIVGIRYDQSKHALQVQKYNPNNDSDKTKDELEWEDVFKAVSHKSDHACCNDV